jgi:uncharacterized protein (TIGR02118 family)
MSFKAMILLTRRPDMTHEQFVQWWREEHAPLARQLPGVRAITFNVVEQDGEPPCDGIAELWFDSKADFEAAYADPIGQQVAADSIAHVSGRVRMMVAEHRIQS